MEPRIEDSLGGRICVDELTGLVLGMFGEAAKADSVPPSDGVRLLDSLDELQELPGRVDP